MTESTRLPETGGGSDAGQWLFLIDPGWRAPAAGVRPPVAAVVGAWLVTGDGSYGGFYTNPDYRPSSPDSPTDPVDATLRLVVRGQADGEALLAALRDATVGVAVDHDVHPLIDRAPDGPPSVLVTTAPLHRRRIQAQDWLEVPTAQLAEWLPEQGVDVLLNPGAPTSVRLDADTFRQSVLAPAPALREGN